MKNIRILISLCFLLSLTACGSSNVVYEGIQYTKTSSTRITFQEQTIPESCSAFAHLLMKTRANSLGQDLADAMQAEAMARGANLVLIGIARENEDTELDENTFDYYGPEYSYNFNRTWLGWKFGFDDWNEGGALISFGADTSRSRKTLFSNSMMVQAVFLRCDEQQ